jgi:hypothetical protein
LDFKTAIDRATHGLTSAGLAKELGLPDGALESGADAAEGPPGWEATLAHALRNRASVYLMLARELERSVGAGP